MQEFLRKRGEIYAIQDQFPANQGEMARIRSQIEQLEESLRHHQRTYDLLMEQLHHRFMEMGDIQNRHPTVRIYTDMSQEGSEVAYGGVVVVNGELITVTGSVTRTTTVIQEATSLILVTGWAASQWPDAILEAYSDCAGAIEVLEQFTRSSHQMISLKHRAALQSLLYKHLGGHRQRLFPRWIPRETPEIRLCDILSRKVLGQVPLRAPLIQMLELVQGDLRGSWTPSARTVLHRYHRACRRGSRMQRDGLNPRPA